MNHTIKTIANKSIAIEFKSFTDEIDDLSAIAQLFTICFNQPFSSKLWYWKYGKGLQYAVTARKDRQIIGHYAGTPRIIHHEQQNIQMLQITDVMVHPKERAAHGKQGVFFQMASCFLDKYVGYEKTFLQAFGFPNERHTQLGIILGLYGRTDKMFDVRWKPIGTNPLKLYGYKELIDSNKTTKIVDNLWHSMKNSLNSFLVGERSGTYITHRYLEHPMYNYKIYYVYHCITRQKKGIFVLRRHSDNTFELMDLVAHIKDMPMLITIARHEVYKQQGESIFSWMSEAMTKHLAKDSTTTDIQVTIPCITYTHCPKPEELQGKWWLMSGDTDWR